MTEYNTYKDCDFMTEPCFYCVFANELTKNEIEKVEEYFEEPLEEVADYSMPDEPVLYIGIDIITELNLHKYYVDYDEGLFESIMDTTLNKYDYYLVYGEGMTWDGKNGFKIYDNLYDVLERDYEHSDVLVQSNGMVAEFIESSHDVPMGHLLYVIGINSDCKDVIEYSEFGYVDSFVNNKLKEVYTHE